MERKKHAKPRTGFKTEGSSSYLDQHPILGDKGMIYITPYSNGKWYFRTWIPEEKKYLRKSLRTTNKKDAIRLAEKEYLDVYATMQRGHKIFGMKFSEVCESFLEEKREQADTDAITQGRLATLTTQVNRWIIPYATPSRKLSELDMNSFYGYATYRREKTANRVEDVTIRNEHTTINAIIKHAHRKGLIPFSECNFFNIQILEPPRRDTFSLEEYRIFYKKMGDWVDESYDSHEEHMRKLIRDFILLKANAFMRFGEITELKWKMVKTKVETDSKGRKQNLCFIQLPKEICKNKKNREFWSRGGTYLDRIKKYSRWTEPEDYVFSHPRFNRRLAKPTYYKYWKQLIRFSGFDALDKHFSYYSLRHFGITQRLFSNVSVYNVAKYAGTRVDYIEKHYEQMDMDKLRKDALKTYDADDYGLILETY